MLGRVCTRFNGVIGGVGKLSWFAGDPFSEEAGDWLGTLSPGDDDKLDWPGSRTGMLPNMDNGRRREAELGGVLSSDP